MASEYRVRTTDGAVDEREVLLLTILKEKLIVLNPGVITDEERADRIITLLRGLKDNQEWFKLLRNEKIFKFATNEQAREIRLVDYGDIKNNDFLATSQFRVEGSADNIRTDLLLFLNGVPLVNIEANHRPPVRPCVRQTPAHTLGQLLPTQIR